MAAQGGHGGAWPLQRHYPRWLKIVTSMERGNYVATCHARDTGYLIGSSAAEHLVPCEEGISKMLDERRYWSDKV